MNADSFKISWKFLFHGVIFTCFFGVASCGPLIPSSGSEKEFFVLTDYGSDPEATETSGSKAKRRWKYRILVRGAKGNRFINSHKIVFSGDPAKRGFFQLAQWVEPPTKQFTSILIKRLESSGRFNNVSRLASSALGDLQLNSEIQEFYHDTSSPPGRVKVDISVELIDLRNRLSIAKKKFSRAIKVEEYSVEGTVAAFSRAVNQIVDDLVLWIDQGAKVLSEE